MIYLHEYFQIFSYFIWQNFKNPRLSRRNTTVDVRGGGVTQLMKLILGLIALDRVTRTQCLMAIGPLVEIRS